MGSTIGGLLLVGLGLALVILGAKQIAVHRAGAEAHTDKYSRNDDSDAIAVWRGGQIVGLLGIVVGVLFLGFASFYTQDAGESKVQVSWTGELVGQTTDAGVHFKAPWVGIRTFDVRNNNMAYVGPMQEGGQPSYTGGNTTGPQITFQDSEGVTGNMDITLRYSLEPSTVLDIYREFQTQENFVQKVIAEGLRAEARITPEDRGTLEVLSSRSEMTSELTMALQERWAEQGIIVEEVYIQEIRYSDEVKARFDEAQAARIAVDKAEADQETARVAAETKVIEAEGVANALVVAAQGQADANRLLSESLTDAILRQRYIDALGVGTVYVVPDGSVPFVGTK